ncbi:MAG: type II toxin-antitoxin system HicA family toxin [Patescibacteria group bacterium]
MTVPIHKGKDIKKGTLNAILGDINLTKDEFVKAFNKS